MTATPPLPTGLPPPLTAECASRIWLGTAGWSYLPDWSGTFYPPSTSASDALARYVEAFPFVEVDATFYAAPAASTVERWARLLPENGRMSFKAPKELVQDTALRPPGVPFGHFCDTLLAHLGERVARIVVQMPPGFVRTPTNDESLRVFVREWAAQVPLAIEFRHVGWRRMAVLDLLREHSVTMVGQDLQDVPNLDRGAFNTSADAAYIRLIGQHDGMSKDRIQRPQEAGRAWWVDRIGELVAAQVRDVYVVANNHYEGHAPATLRALAAELRAARLPVVPFTGWPDGQVSLF